MSALEELKQKALSRGYTDICIYMAVKHANVNTNDDDNHILRLQTFSYDGNGNLLLEEEEEFIHTDIDKLIEDALYFLNTKHRKKHKKTINNSIVNELFKI